MLNEYASKRLKLRRPPLLLSFIQVAGGALIILILIIGIIYNFGLLKGTYDLAFDLYRSSENSRGGMTYLMSRTYILTLILFMIIFVPALFRFTAKGLKWIISGFSEIVTPYMPANIPEPFKDYTEVEKGFKERTLEIYKTFDSFISGLFGRNSMFVTPTRRKIVEENGAELKRRARKFIFAVLALASVWLIYNWLTSDSGMEFLSDMDLAFIFQRIDPSIPIFLLVPFIAIILLQGTLAFIEFISILMMIPRLQPSTVAIEGTQHYRGFGHPDQIFSRLPDLAQQLRWEGFLNRIDSTWGERASAAVGDVGEFNGRLIIEQQPKPMDNMGDRPAYLLLFLGWILFFVGLIFYLFFLLPSYVKQGELNHLYAPVYVVFVGIAASIASRSGDRFIGYAREILQSAQFRSLAILIQITGTLSRADVRVGKSIADSIESSNVVVRSDFSARLWSAELFSEASRLDAKRELIALEQSEEGRIWLDFFREEIENLREEGIKPIGIDLQSKEMDDILKANISVSALRSGTIERAQLKASVAGDDTPLLQLGSEATSADSDTINEGSSSFPPGEYKECPECAEMVRVRARKCRFCGYRFDEE